MAFYAHIKNKGCNIFFIESSVIVIVEFFNVNTVTSVGHQMLPVILYNCFVQYIQHYF